MGGDGRLIAVLFGSGLGGASMESCALVVLPEVPFGSVLDVSHHGILDGVPLFSLVLLSF